MTHRQTILSHLLRGDTIDRDSASELYGIKGLSGVITALKSIGVQVHSRRVGKCQEYWLRTKQEPRQWQRP
jgi:hypothetical protein